MFFQESFFKWFFYTMQESSTRITEFGIWKARKRFLRDIRMHSFHEFLITYKIIFGNWKTDMDCIFLIIVLLYKSKCERHWCFERFCDSYSKMLCLGIELRCFRGCFCRRRFLRNWNRSRRRSCRDFLWMTHQRIFGVFFNVMRSLMMCSSSID